MAETKRMTAEQVVSYLLEEEGVDFLRESLCWVVQQLMEAEVSELIGAEHGERNPERLTHRNGYRSRRWDTRAGEIELAIPKIRRGSYFPSFLEPRRRSEQALVSVVQQAYVCGVSTRKVDQLVESLGLRVSRSEVSRICAGLDEQVEAFRTRPLEGRYPYLWLDAKVEKVRDGGRVVRKCLVIAHGVHETGRREVIGLDCGECETEAFWREFLRSLVKRGLAGVPRVTQAYRQAIAGPFFDDTSFVNYEDTVFPHYYFAASDSWSAGEVQQVPPAWRIAFDAAANHTVSAAGDLLLGVNAHVQRDLPFVLYSIGLVAPDGTSRKPDFDRVNIILNSVMAPVLAEIARRFDPTIDDTNLPTSLDDAALFQLLAAWREDAWRDAEALADAPTPQARNIVAAQIENNAANEARVIEASTAYPPLSGGSSSRDAYCAVHHNDP